MKKYSFSKFISILALFALGRLLQRCGFLAGFAPKTMTRRKLLFQFRPRPPSSLRHRLLHHSLKFSGIRQQIVTLVWFCSGSCSQVSVFLPRGVSRKYGQQWQHPHVVCWRWFANNYVFSWNLTFDFYKIEKMLFRFFRNLIWLLLIYPSFFTLQTEVPTIRKPSRGGRGSRRTCRPWRNRNLIRWIIYFLI